MGLSERLRYRFGRRSSSAASPHKNKHAERKAGQDAEWLAEIEEGIEVWDEYDSFPQR